MIKHIVNWKLKDFAEGKSKSENIVIMKQMLLLLKDKLSMINELEIGINFPEIDTSNWDIVLISSFKSMEDLNAYQVHPEHKKVSEFIGKIRELRASIDFEY